MFMHNLILAIIRFLISLLNVMHAFLDLKECHKCFRIQMLNPLNGN